MNHRAMTRPRISGSRRLCNTVIMDVVVLVFVAVLVGVLMLVAVGGPQARRLLAPYVVH